MMDINKQRAETMREKQVTDNHIWLQLTGCFMSRCEAASKITGDYAARGLPCLGTFKPAGIILISLLMFVQILPLSIN